LGGLGQKRMRILYWSELFWPYIGGAEVWGARLILGLQERGHEFIVVTSQDYLELPEVGQYGNVAIHRFPFRKALTEGDVGLLIGARRQVAELKSTFRPDLVHMNGVNPSGLFHLQTLGAHPSPLLVTMNQEILPGEGAGSQTLVGRVLSAADWVSCVSAAVLDQVRQWLPETTRRSSVIYTGMEMPVLSASSPPNDAPRLLCVGRLVPAKGFDVALRAIAQIIDRFPQLRVVVAGDGPERPHLEQQAAVLGLSEAVEFLGWVEPTEVPDLINSATAVLLPSRREGLPVVAVQAALLGRPIVATRVAGLPELVIHRETGLLVDRENAGALAEAVTSLLDDPAASAQMGQAARRRAEEVFSWSHCVSAHDALYRELVEKE